MCFKGYNKAVTRTRALTRTTRRISTFGRRQTRCLSRASSISRTRLGRIILRMYRMSTGKENLAEDSARCEVTSRAKVVRGVSRSFLGHESLTPICLAVRRGYPGGSMPPNNATGQDMYNRYSSGQQPASYPTGTPPNARSNSYPSGPQAHPATVQQQTATSNQPSSPSQPPAASSYSCPQEYYRQEQVIPTIMFFLFRIETIINQSCTSGRSALRRSSLSKSPSTKRRDAHSRPVFV